LLRRLAVVVRAWTTRRLLWLWFFAYACVLTSGYLRPISPRDTYFDRRLNYLPLREGKGVRPAGTVVDQSLVLMDADQVRGWTVSKIRQLRIERVFVGGETDDLTGFRKVCDALPGVPVWHWELNGGRIASTVFLLLATLTLGGAVLQQTQAVFSLPLVRTRPGFTVPHLLISLTLAGTGIVAASFIARAFGADFFATAAVQVFAWGAWSAFEFHVLSLPRFTWRRRRAPQVASDPPAATGRLGGWSGALVLLAIAACLATFIARPYILESFLLGELPWLAAVFLVIGAALGGAAVVLMPTFCVWMNETGASAILSLQDIEKRRVEHGVLTSRFGRHLERLRRPSRMPRWLWQIHAMRSGNPDLLLSVVVRIVAPVVLVVGLQLASAAVAAPDPDPPIYSTAFVLLFLGAGWLIALSHTFSNWWQRRKTFSAQLLYPWTRRQLVRSAFVGYAFDALGILAVLFVTLIFCATALAWPLGLRAILSGALAIVLSAALLITGGLWLLTLRHRLLAGFLAVIGVLLLMTLGMSFLQSGKSLWRIALFFALVAWLFGLDAWRRWMKTEWGLFGPS
jgi:hypothetical protein